MLRNNGVLISEAMQEVNEEEYVYFLNSILHTVSYHLLLANMTGVTKLSNL